VKFKQDTRYSVEDVSTHDLQTWKAVPASCLADIEAVALENQVIGIDEGQFFPDLVDFCERMADLGKKVIVAALDGTFQRKKFGDVCELISLCEEVHKLNAICMICSEEAAFSKRLTTETDVQLIGGSDKYIAVCRKCFNLPNRVVPPSQKGYQEAVHKTATNPLADLSLSDVNKHRLGRAL